MVCLYGLTLEAVGLIVELENLDLYYPIWNWQIHLLTKFMLDTSRNISKSSGYADDNEIPYIPSNKCDNVWSEWFTKIGAALRKEFYDTTDQLTFRCLENAPTEEVSILIFEATDLQYLKAFYSWCCLTIEENIIGGGEATTSS